MDPATANLIGNVTGEFTRQRNNTNILSNIMPSGYNNTAFYLTIIVALLVIGLVGYALFAKK